MTNRSMTSIAFLATTALAFFGTTLHGQTECRVSVKFILDGQGRRPTFGSINTDAEVLNQVSLANGILESAERNFRLRLIEILDLDGVSQFASAECQTADRDSLEAAAEADPATYAWRSDAINVYISHAPCGGICSFPGSSDLILLGQGAPSATLLHEIGHYMGLCHTQGCYCGPCGGSCSTPGTDNIADTLPDLACWTQDDIAFNAFGTSYSSLSTSQKRRVDDVFFNVMSYHVVQNRLTADQMDIVQANSEGPRSNVVGCTVPVRGVAEANDGLGSAIAHGDFNGDGFLDLAIGVPGEAIESILAAGAVNVLYGTPLGVGQIGNQIWHQEQPGIPGVSQAGDGFGAALVVGDFDQDGFDDLAIGVPGEGVGSEGAAGAVNVIYGGPAGLTSTRAQIWYQDQPGIPGVSQHGDSFGAALVVGDFDHDGSDDLAVGAPGEGVGSEGAAGAVNVIYGGPAGLTSTRAQIWYQDQPGIPGVSQQGDSFGAALVVGDFDHDGSDDLAIGAPGEGVGSESSAGAVNVIYGGSAGLASTRAQIWHQEQPGIPGVAESSDSFGRAVGIGDFDHDGFDDLAIGVSGEDVGREGAAGAVNVVYGGSAGLASTRAQIWHQDQPGIPGTAEPFDFFGNTVGTGDFDRDGYDDLAIGVPGEGVGSENAAGAVNVIYGGPAGLASARAEVWDQDSPEIGSAAESGDGFGSTVAVCDFDGDGFEDLLIGVPYEDVGSVSDAGIVQVIRGGMSGLDRTDDQILHQDVDSPSNCLRLLVEPLQSPGEGSLTVTYGTPFSRVWIGFSLTGGGPIGSSVGPVLLSPPIQRLTLLPMNNAGTASLTFAIPPGMVGTRIWFQAYDLGSRELSNGIATAIVTP